MGIALFVFKLCIYLFEQVWAHIYLYSRFAKYIIEMDNRNRVYEFYVFSEYKSTYKQYILSLLFRDQSRYAWIYNSAKGIV